MTRRRRSVDGGEVDEKKIYRTQHKTTNDNLVDIEKLTAIRHYCDTTRRLEDFCVPLRILLL